MGQQPINSCAIPVLPVHAGALEAAAGKLRTSAGSVRTHGAGVRSAWAGLAGVYHAPESATLVSAMDPVATGTDSFAGDAEQVASVLSTFAAEAGPLAAKMASTKTAAMSFESKANGTDDWAKHGDLVNKNNDLLHTVNTTLVAYQAAERRAANAIERLIGGHTFHAIDPDKKHQDRYAYGFSSIPDEAKMPWGGKVKKEDGCFASTMTHVGHFFKGVGEAAWGMVKGLGSLLWNGLGFGGWQKFKAMWSGLGQTGIIGLFTLGPKEWARRNMAIMKSMVHWDDWKKDPSKAAGETVTDVLTIVGTGGAGAVVKGGATAGKVADVAEAAGDAGKVGKVGDAAGATSKISKAGELTRVGVQALRKYADPATYLRGLGKIPKVGDILAGLKTRIGGLHGLGGAGHDIDHATAGWGDKHVDIDNKLDHPGSATHGDAPHVAHHADAQTPHADGPTAGHDGGHVGGQVDGGGTAHHGDGSVHDTGSTGHAENAPARSDDVPVKVRLSDGAEHTVTFSRAELAHAPSSHEYLQAALQHERISPREFNEMVRAPHSDLSASDAAMIDRVRRSIPAVAPDEPLSKALSAQAGEALLHHQVPKEWEGTVKGYVARSGDLTDLHSVADYHNGLALTYHKGTPFLEPGREPAFPANADHSYVLRFQSADVPVVPRSPQWGGDIADPPPFTGNGFTASSKHLIPEYIFNRPADLEPGAEMWRVSANGDEQLAGVLNADGEWVAVR